MQKTLENSRKINEELKFKVEIIEKISTTLNGSVSSIQLNLSEQQQKFEKVFSRVNGQLEDIKEFQIWLLGDYFDIKTICFYATSVFVILIITSFSQLSSIRSLLLMCNNLFSCKQLRLNSANSVRDNGEVAAKIHCEQFHFQNDIRTRQCKKRPYHRYQYNKVQGIKVCFHNAQIGVFDPHGSYFCEELFFVFPTGGKDL